MAPILITRFHIVYGRGNTCKQNGCHTLLISDYSSVSKYSLTRECNVALGGTVNTVSELVMLSRSLIVQCIGDSSICSTM